MCHSDEGGIWAEIPQAMFQSAIAFRNDSLDVLPIPIFIGKESALAAYHKQFTNSSCHAGADTYWHREVIRRHHNTQTPSPPTSHHSSSFQSHRFQWGCFSSNPFDHW